MYDRLRALGGTARAEDAQGTPIQGHMSPSILVYEEKTMLQSKCVTSFRSFVLGPSGYDFDQHRPTPRPSVERIRRKALFSDL